MPPKAGIKAGIADDASNTCEAVAFLRQLVNTPTPVEEEEDNNMQEDESQRAILCVKGNLGDLPSFQIITIKLRTSTLAKNSKISNLDSNVAHREEMTTRMNLLRSRTNKGAVCIIVTQFFSFFNFQVSKGKGNKGQEQLQENATIIRYTKKKGQLRHGLLIE
jgi:hypothetical protein